MRTMYTSPKRDFRQSIRACCTGLLVVFASCFYSTSLHAQCDITAQGVIAYCNSFSNGTVLTDSFFIGFRVLSLDGDTLDVVDLEGNAVTNRGKRIDDLGSEDEPDEITIQPLMIAGGMDTVEIWYFGPFANGATFDIALVDPNGDCDTVFVTSGTFTCVGQDPSACDLEDPVPLWFLDFSMTEFDFGQGDPVNEDVGPQFLIMERTRELTCCDVGGNSIRCFEFLVRLDENDIGITIDDVGSGSTGGVILADSLSGFECTGDINTTWPFQQDNGQSNDIFPLCLVAGVQDYIVLNCKPGGNTTSAVIGAVRAPSAEPDITVEPCNAELQVFGADTVMWASDDDPNLDNFVSCNGDSTICQLLYNIGVFTEVTECEGDTFFYYASAMPAASQCFESDTVIVDTTYVVVYPVFEVMIDSVCDQTGDSLLLTAVVTSAAAGCSYDYDWSTGENTESIVVPVDGALISVTVTRDDVPMGAQGCVVVADTIQALASSGIDCSAITDASFQCVDDVPPADPSLVIVSGCAVPTDTIVEESVNGGAGCNADPLVITRLYIVEFGDGASFDTCTQTITVVDDTPPVINCPADVTVNCGENTAPANTGFANATDNCDDTPAIDFTDDVTVGACSDEIIITRTWVALDDCGNQSSCIQTISVVDNTAPQITCPADITIECGESTEPGNTGTASATDNCDAAVSITFSDSVTPGACAQESTIERTWTATDNCGNSTSCVQTISVEDSTPPTIFCPGDVTVSCGGDTSPGNTGTAEASDNCDGMVDVSFSDMMVPGDCPEESTIMRTWTATDDCGNQNTCVQFIFFGGAEIEDIDFPPDLKGDDALPCFPPPDTTPAATGMPEVEGVLCNLVISYADEIAVLCSGSYKILRLWTIADCNGTVFVDSTQIIEVSDMTPPVVDVPDTLFVSAMANCVADVNLPEATITDDCSDIHTVRVEGPFGTINGNGGLVEDLEMGCHQIIYIATSDCALEGRDTLIVCVVDDVPPSAICNQLVAIPLNNMGMATIPADAFDGGSNDNCSPVYFKVRRMDAPIGYECFAGDNENYMLDDVVKFCCEDIPNNNIMVVLRVYDVEPPPGIVPDDLHVGHFTECMVQVEVQDKLPPQIVCPSDLTISCEYPFDPENLDVFGTVVTDPGDREEICLDDPGNPETDGLTCVGLDGLATDNCNLTVTETESIIVDEICGTGTITRTFVATDEGGLSASCQQVITIINYTPFTEEDITFPPDFETEDLCEVDALDPEDLPPPFNQPVVNDDVCDLVTFTHNDIVFDFSGMSQACFKILRTWTVIDWCQYDAEEQIGIWSDVQVIKVNNTTGPEILSALDDATICTDDALCGPGNVLLEASANDDCTNPESLKWTILIDHDSDLSIDQSSGMLFGASVEFPALLPLGTHRILYTVEDLCGNATTEEQVITMVSCKPPSAKCQNITTTLMAVDANGDGEVDGGMAEIWASDLDAGSDHACGHPVQVAFSNDPNDTSIMFDCDDVGENVVQLWVIDINGNTDFCNVTVTVQDNSEVCPEDLNDNGMIAGQVQSSSSAMMKDVMIKLNGSTLLPEFSDDEGSYAFPLMPLGGAYVVEPELNVNHKQGVSTIDLIRIQKHLLGIELFDTPYKYIAADANRTGTVTATDILILRKLILGIIDELPGNTSWRFVDAGYQFPDPSDPFSTPFPEVYEIPDFANDMMEVDFVGVKIGDVNESALNLDPGTYDGTDKASAVELHIADATLSAGETHTFDISLSPYEGVEGVQLTLGWDPEAIEVVDMHRPDGQGSAEWNTAFVHDGKLPLSWMTDAAFRGQTDVISVTIRATRVVKLSEMLYVTSDITRSEAVTAQGATDKISLKFASPGVKSQELILHQNIPNPFSRTTTIPYEVGTAGPVDVYVYDAIGSLVLHRSAEAEAGYNEFVIDADELGHTGLLLYNLQTQSMQQTKRMIIADE